jgi:hypothetical protein
LRVGADAEGPREVAVALGFKQMLAAILQNDTDGLMGWGPDPKRNAAFGELSPDRIASHCQIWSGSAAVHT